MNLINLEDSLENIQYEGHDEGRVINLPFPQLRCLIANRLNVSTLIFKSTFIERLYTSYCPITEFTAKLMNTLQYFVADSCKISNMNFLFNQNNENHVIKEIDLSYNILTEIPLIKSNSLQKLLINGNRITNVNSLANSSLPELQSLNISSN